MAIGASASSPIDSRYSSERPSSAQQTVQLAVIKNQANQEQAVANVVEQNSRAIQETAQSASRPGVGGNVDIRA
jgi:hypothetical protein